MRTDLLIGVGSSFKAGRRDPPLGASIGCQGSLHGRDHSEGIVLGWGYLTEPKVAKNRCHVDLASLSDKDQMELVARLEGLGAQHVDIGQGPDVSWFVMADREGNELCVVSHAGTVGADPASAFGDLWPVAAVVLDSPDPEAIASFWAESTGWPILGRDGIHVWLRDTTANGPYLDIRHNDDPKATKLRVHLDIAPTPTTTKPPPSTTSSTWAPTPSTSAKPPGPTVSPGTSSPIPKATNSVSSPPADKVPLTRLTPETRGDTSLGGGSLGVR